MNMMQKSLLENVEKYKALTTIDSDTKVKVEQRYQELQNKRRRRKRSIQAAPEYSADDRQQDAIAGGSGKPENAGDQPESAEMEPLNVPAEQKQKNELQDEAGMSEWKMDELVAAEGLMQLDYESKPGSGDTSKLTPTGAKATHTRKGPEASEPGDRNAPDSLRRRRSYGEHPLKNAKGVSTHTLQKEKREQHGRKRRDLGDAPYDDYSYSGDGDGYWEELDESYW